MSTRRASSSSRRLVFMLTSRDWAKNQSCKTVVHAIAIFSPRTWSVELALADKMEELRETLQEVISKVDRISDSSPSFSSPPDKRLTGDPMHL